MKVKLENVLKALHNAQEGNTERAAFIFRVLAASYGLYELDEILKKLEEDAALLALDGNERITRALCAKLTTSDVDVVESLLTAQLCERLEIDPESDTIEEELLCYGPSLVEL